MSHYWINILAVPSHESAPSTLWALLP